MISGIWLSVKSKVSGMMPKTLKLDPGVGREIAPDHLVQHRQERGRTGPSARSACASPRRRAGRPNRRRSRAATCRRAARRAARAPNSVLTMVGFILMKISSCSQSVSPPKTKTTTPVTSGMIGRRARQQPGDDERDRRRDHEQRRWRRRSARRERRAPGTARPASRRGHWRRRRPAAARAPARASGSGLSSFCSRIVGRVAFEDRLDVIVVRLLPRSRVAKSPAEKGSRSSTCSPTPMK